MDGAQPAPKRRRLDPPGEASELAESATLTTISRQPDDVRGTLRDNLLPRLDEFGDVIVCVAGEEGAADEVPCIASLLATASRPLGAMLYGPLRACTPQSGDGRPKLQLRLTEPEHFKHLLRYIHGQDIPLTVDDAFDMHRVADFYEVLGLRDACGRFLLDSLRPHNCCHLLHRAHEVHCEPLQRRCLDLLTLDFIAVVEHDDDFPSLDPEALSMVVARDELVCAEEYEVFDAIAIWYERAPSALKYAALLQLLHLVRWPLLYESRRADVLEHAARLVPPPAEPAAQPLDLHDEGASGSPPRLISSDGGDEAGPSSAAIDEEAAGAFAAAQSGAPPGALRGRCPSVAATETASEYDGGRGHGTADESDADGALDGDDEADGAAGGGAAATPRRGGAGCSSADDADDEADEEAETVRLVCELFPARTAGATPASTRAAAGGAPCRTRQFSWGQLIARTPQPSGATQPPEPERVHVLMATKEYMIGRSRKSDIRIGHNAPMPYISSQHCRIYHSIRWPEADEAMVDAAACDAGPAWCPGGSGGGDSMADDSQDVGGATEEGGLSQPPPPPPQPPQPRLQAWLEDLSQNGTFVNGQLVGRNKQQPLASGDRIEMVFPQGRQPPSQSNTFPIFTFMPHTAAPSTPSHGASSPLAAAAAGDDDSSPPSGLPMGGELAAVH